MATASPPLLVLPTQGDAGWQRLLQGNDAHGILQAVPCPVLAVRSQTLRSRGLP